VVLAEPPGSDVLFVVFVMAALLVSRGLGFWLVHRLRRRWPRRVLIAGAGHVAEELDRALIEHREYGLTPAAFVADVAVPDADRPVYSYAEAFDAIQDLQAVGLLCAFGPETGWTVRDDPRRTRAGRMLRKTSLDELPQLLNVIRGDMSLVGPRPERRAFADQFARDIPTYPERTRTAGGITGLAQVHDLRGDTSIEDRARFDNLYIDQYSLFLDVVIALQTIGSLFRSKQAY
jgi:FlaA1/EpsC-like NDP-sugar epimerase